MILRGDINTYDDIDLYVYTHTSLNECFTMFYYFCVTARCLWL